MYVTLSAENRPVPELPQPARSVRHAPLTRLGTGQHLYREGDPVERLYQVVSGVVRLTRMLDNLAVIIGVEALCAAQGIEARAPLKTSKSLQNALDAIRAAVPSLTSDRYLAPDIEAGATLVQSDALAKATGVDLGL